MEAQTDYSETHARLQAEEDDAGLTPPLGQAYRPPPDVRVWESQGSGVNSQATTQDPESQSQGSDESQGSGVNSQATTQANNQDK